MRLSNQIINICILLLVFNFTSCKNIKASQEITAKINIEAKGEPISKYIYGMFIENLGNDDVGNLVDDCLWAELLDDRKFFYPVDDKDELIPINKKEKINQWKPVGNLASVVMDSLDSYVGAHSPKIILNSENETGISQTGLALIKNKNYTGRVILKATSGVEVSVSLVFDNDFDNKQTVTFKNLTNEYKRYDFEFNSKKNYPKATLKITGQGKGSFTVGAVSLMPSDNIDGFRPDVIKLLKDLNSGIYRWGGNFISGYDWRDGVGNPDKRAPRYEFAWECLEDNDVGTEEMIRFAQLIDVELAMTVNTGFGEAYSASQWVEYVNGSIDTPMGKLREKNGHQEPYNIKLWCVGNESYGKWQLGHIDLKDHIIKHNMFVEKMLEKDPTLILIGSGASIEETTITGNASITESSLKNKKEAQVIYDSEDDWTGGMLRNANHLGYISEHFYCAVDKRFDLKKRDYVYEDAPFEDWTRRPANRIKLKAQHYQEYHKRIPGSEKIPVYLDEWAYYTNWVHPSPTLGVTIGYARALNEIIRNTDLIKMAGFTFGTSCLSFNDTEVDYNATGLLFKLYQSKLGTIPIRIEGNVKQPEPKWPIGGDQPKENAGGNTYPLDMIATLTEDGKSIALAIVNPTESNQQITIDLKLIKTADKIKKYTISSTSILGKNKVGKVAEVKLSEQIIDKENTLSIGAATINIFTYKIL